jgi:hypothetical protein
VYLYFSVIKYLPIYQFLRLRNLLEFLELIYNSTFYIQTMANVGEKKWLPSYRAVATTGKNGPLYM